MRERPRRQIDADQGTRSAPGPLDAVSPHPDADLEHVPRSAFRKPRKSPDIWFELISSLAVRVVVVTLGSADSVDLAAAFRVPEITHARLEFSHAAPRIASH